MKTPSKHISLERLELIKRNHYIGETGQEYVSSEVDELIWKKQSQKDNENMLTALKNMGKLHVGVVRSWD